MGQVVKCWILVHYKTNPEQDFLSCFDAKGFAIFSTENWQEYCLNLPNDTFFTRLNGRQIDCIRSFKDREDYLRHLYIIFLSDEEFENICRGVLGVSPCLLKEIDSKAKERQDCAPLAKYGIFPEFTRID